MSVISTNTWRWAVAAIGLLAVSAAPSFAAEANQPSQTTATFGNWTVRCNTVAKTSEKVCEMVHLIQSKEKKGALANVAIGKLPGQSAFRIVVQLPLDNRLAQPVELSVGGKSLVTLPYETCFPAFCVAGGEFPDAASEAFKQGKNFVIAYKSRNGADRKIQASLNGFTDAYRSTFE